MHWLYYFMSALFFIEFIKLVAKKIKCEAKQFNKFNKTRAQMFYFIYHRTSNLLKNHTFGVKKSIFCHLFCSVVMDVIK